MLPQLYHGILVGMLWLCVLEHIPALHTYTLAFHLNIPMQLPPEFVAMANRCIRKFAYTIKSGFATFHRDFNALHFMATSFIRIVHDFIRIALSRFWQRCFLSLDWFDNYKFQALLITRYALMSEHRTRKFPILFSDEARQNSVVPDEVMATILLVAVPYLLKPFDKSTTHVSWYCYSDMHTVIRWQRLIVDELSQYDIVSAVRGIMEWNTSFICAFARLICTGEIDPVPMREVSLVL